MIRNKHTILVLKVILTAIILYFLGRQIQHHWTDIKDYSWDFNLWYLVGSVFCAQVALVLFTPMWQNHIGSFGYKVTLAESYKVLYLSSLGRYVPGKVWQVFGILYLTGKKGIPAEPAGASFVILQMFTIPSSLLVFVLASQLRPTILIDQVSILGEYSGYLMTALMLTVCVVLVIHPQPFLRIMNIVLRRLGRPEMEFRLDKSVALKLFVGYFFIWVVYGLSFWLFVRAVLPHSDVDCIATIGVYCVAYQAGYLALFAPGGLGPRELVMGALLFPLVGPIAPLVAILARLWSLLTESIAALIALKIKM